VARVIQGPAIKELVLAIPWVEVRSEQITENLKKARADTSQVPLTPLQTLGWLRFLNGVHGMVQVLENGKLAGSSNPNSLRWFLEYIGSAGDPEETELLLEEIQRVISE